MKGLAILSIFPERMKLWFEDLSIRLYEYADLHAVVDGHSVDLV